MNQLQFHNQINIFHTMNNLTRLQFHSYRLWEHNQNYLRLTSSLENNHCIKNHYFQSQLFHIICILGNNFNIDHTNMYLYHRDKELHQIDKLGSSHNFLDPIQYNMEIYKHMRAHHIKEFDRLIHQYSLSILLANEYNLSSL